MITKKTEHGQALVLMVLGFVAMLGFTALALDGGNIYMSRRNAQNAADAAALAAALAKISSQNWQQAGLNQAATFGYTNTATSSVALHNPPVSGFYAGDGEYIQVFVNTSLKTSFAHFVYNGPLAISVEAVVRVLPPQNIFPGNALHAVNESYCGAALFSGSTDVTVTGGNVFSNSDKSGVPTSCTSGVKNGSSGSIEVNGGAIKTVGTFRNQTGVPIDADEGIIEGVAHEDLPPVPVPDCSHLPVRSYHAGDTSLQPGIYPNGIKITGANAEVNLASGMYCFGDDFTANGGLITGTGLMFYMEDGAFDLGGNTFVSLTASNNLVDNSGKQWAGMLLYMGPDNHQQVKITGNSGSTYVGTIYAPATNSPLSQPRCKIAGTSGVTAGNEQLNLSSQVICNTFEITGNADVNIFYAEEQNYHLDPMLSQYH